MNLQRVEMLLGTAAVEKLNHSSVAVLGLGGVGSYVAEALCRSGVGNLLLLDGDVVESSNINRQLPALQNTIGHFKVEVMAERLRQINPECNIHLVGKFYKPGDFRRFLGDDGRFVLEPELPGAVRYPDFLADAIDDTAAKVDVLVTALKQNIPVISAMGTGNKLDPTKLQLADISKTYMCPFAKSIRKRLREQGITKGVTVVFSTETPIYADKSATPGSMVFVPASAGLLMASYIVRKLVNLA
jgi:tRNA A37 threonylcarbamoyladenosine dehydratase